MLYKKMDKFINNNEKYKNIDKYNNNFYTSLDENQIKNIRQNYKVVDVDFLDTIEVNSKMYDDKYFTKIPERKEIINDVVNFCVNDVDKKIYKKTDYICYEKEKLCICNIHAEDFRKIYDGFHYKENKKYNDKF